MHNYYFVGTILPELRIGYPVEISFKQLDTLLQLNLSESDYAKTEIIRRYWDIENFRSYWKGEPLDQRGNLDKKELEEALIEKEGQPSYIGDYLEKYESDGERLQHFSELMASYFRGESKKSSGFLRRLLEFQRELKLVLTAFRAKKLGRSLSAELQFEDPEDPFIAQLLAYRDAASFEPPEKFEDLKPVFEMFSESPLALHQAICQYIFNTIDRMVGLETFTLDRILGYMVQLSLAEQWLELDKIKGTEIVDRFVKEKA